MEFGELPKKGKIYKCFRHLRDNMIIEEEVDPEKYYIICREPGYTYFKISNDASKIIEKIDQRCEYILERYRIPKSVVCSIEVLLVLSAAASKDMNLKYLKIPEKINISGDWLNLELSRTLSEGFQITEEVSPSNILPF